MQAVLQAAALTIVTCSRLSPTLSSKRRDDATGRWADVRFTSVGSAWM